MEFKAEGGRQKAEGRMILNVKGWLFDVEAEF